MPRAPRWSDVALLNCDAPIPLDRPFSTATAVHAGVSKRLLTDLVTRGHGDEHREADEGRLDWLRKQRAWTMDVFDKDAVYGRTPDPFVTLQAGFERALAKFGVRSKSYIDLGR